MKTLFVALLLAGFGCGQPVCDADGDGDSCTADCADGDALIHAGAEELCDGIDNDCDGTVDRSTEFQGYIDDDGDGFKGGESYTVCHDELSYLDSDCDETDTSINIGVPEQCADDIDNDCDGTIDEFGCADWVYVGETATTGIGGVYVATGDSSVWADRNYAYDDVPSRLAGFRGDPGERSLTETWRYEGDGLRFGNMSVAVHDGIGYIAVVEVNSEGVQLLQLQDDGAAPLFVSSHSNGGTLWQVSVESSTDGLMLAASNYDRVVLYDNPDQGDGALVDGARFQLLDDRGIGGFADMITLLPDPGGDGVPELVIYESGGKEEALYQAVYIIDGLSTGTVTIDDADAVIADHVYYSYKNLGSAGDLDEDGQVDLNAGSYFLRPLEGIIDGQDPDIRFGCGAAGASLDGDSHIDLTTTWNGTAGPSLGVLFGPVAPGTYTLDTADLVVPFLTAGENETLDADIDLDGQAELVLGWDRYMSQSVEGSGTLGPGLLAAYNIDSWEY